MAERFPQQLLLGRVGQVFLRPDHVADLHADVVDDIGEQEHRGPVGAGDHEVLEVAVVEGGRAPDQVDHHRLTLIRRPEAQRRLLSGLQAAIPAEAVVPAHLLAGRRPEGDVVPGAVAVVRLPGQVQLSAGGGVSLGIVRLEQRPFVGPALDAEPVQRVEDALHPLRTVPGRVGVLDPQHELAAVLAGVDPVLQGRSRSADMKQSSRRGGKTYSHGHVT